MHAPLGRFVSRDPIFYAAGTNLVEYVSDSPTNRRDPTGNVSIDNGKPPYDPEHPNPIPDDTPIEIQIDDISSPTTFCGFISPQGMKNCKEKITWHEKVWFACSVQKAALKAAGGVCKHVQGMISKVKGTNKGYRYDCPKPKTCCMKKRYNGTHPVTVTLKKVSVGPGCSLSATVTATLTFKGEIGVCK